MLQIFFTNAINGGRIQPLAPVSVGVRKVLILAAHRIVKTQVHSPAVRAFMRDPLHPIGKPGPADPVRLRAGFGEQRRTQPDRRHRHLQLARTNVLSRPRLLRRLSDSLNREIRRDRAAPCAYKSSIRKSVNTIAMSSCAGEF